ncbi:hypothetical protein R1sor_011717 [Riccia sorocarpa]|uniref:Rab-GAP TBC domain-containing protein n=1 Tax=Riccia sorocarpa TaxID=122646 RepID=A0ABD3I2Q5_9MARC
MSMTVSSREVEKGWTIDRQMMRGPPDWQRRDFKVKVIDLYLFPLEVSVDEAVIFNLVKEKVREQTRRWLNMEASKGVGWYLQSDISSISDQYVPASLSISTLTSTLQLKKLIRKGIPPTLRPKVWQAVSGAARKRSNVPDSYYSDLSQAVIGAQTASTRQIDHDLARTFPSHPWVDSPEGQATLRRVLVAYSFRDSSVGYCQGMNYVAALLLLVMKTEEDAFWMLAVLLENVLFSESFAEDLRGCHLAQRVFKDLLKKKFPRLAQHLDQIGFDSTLVTTEWFLCLFAKSFPSETTMRVWDVLFNEGVKVLFRVALAVFKLNEDALLAAKHAGQAIKILQDSMSHLYDPDVLLKIAFDKVGQLSVNTINKQSRKEQPQLMADLQRRLQRLNSPRPNSLDSPILSPASGSP